ncbi:MAG: hypothetical protein IJV90_02595 [Candidatus Methanomethylophilaceae archaeon]|nr:hypothetical protein [Candidatus Methanomethylophilaceae archaeon]
MTMTAEEAMQALLEGEVVYCYSCGEIHKFRLSDEGKLQSWHDNPGGWETTPWLLNSIEGVYDEYPLVFKEALKAMLDGKTVESDVSKRKYHLMNIYGYHETFVEVGDESCTTILTEIKLSEQIGKWKVVE